MALNCYESSWTNDAREYATRNTKRNVTGIVKDNLMSCVIVMTFEVKNLTWGSNMSS
jgi:hypothetical protein